MFDDPSENTQFGKPKQVLDLADCVCRPHGSDPCCFEIGVPKGPKGDASVPGSGPPMYGWISMWAESEVQCRAWVMAIQHSARPQAPSSRPISE